VYSARLGEEKKNRAKARDVKFLVAKLVAGGAEFRHMAHSQERAREALPISIRAGPSYMKEADKQFV
jgi:hypothetical protein